MRLKWLSNNKCCNLATNLEIVPCSCFLSFYHLSRLSCLSQRYCVISSLEKYAFSYQLLFPFVVFQSLSCVQLFVTPWTVGRQAPLSLGFPGKNTGEGCHFLLQRIFPTQGLNPHHLHWQADSLFFIDEPPGKPP